MQKRVGNVRWFIATSLSTGIVVNYLNRVAISAAAKPLIAEYHLSNARLGLILSSFLRPILYHRCNCRLVRC
ncbi:MAG TPA: hypothetical protein VKV20_03070 [Ktedonobacteraceae bacterium]|jgi:ACS family D-galactonate transporter-like MFS transporter|nr:hypothetical protein [Ktedonobacteraceae bacterium]